MEEVSPPEEAVQVSIATGTDLSKTAVREVLRTEPDAADPRATQGQVVTPDMLAVTLERAVPSDALSATQERTSPRVDDDDIEWTGIPAQTEFPQEQEGAPRSLNVTQAAPRRAPADLQGTVAAPMPASVDADVIAVGTREIAHALLVAVGKTREGFLQWQRALAAQKPDDMSAAETLFSEGLAKVREWMEKQNLGDEPLADEERIDVIARILFGKPLWEVQGEDRKVLQAFETVQMLENPKGKFGAPMAALAKRMEEMDICFASPESQWLLLRLLEIDLWGARDAPQLMAEIVTTLGYETDETQELGRGANGGVVHLKRKSAEHVLPAGVEIGPDEELVAKFPTNGLDITLEVERSLRASEARVGPRCIPSGRDDIALLMIYEKGARELKDYMADQPFDLGLIQNLATQLQTLHTQAGLVHRDFKPANVLVRPGGREALFIDFGLSENVPPGGSADEPGIIRGSPLYLPPEGLADGTWGVQTDVYALGCIAFEWATGKIWAEHAAEIARENGETMLGVIATQMKLRADPALFRQALSALDGRPALRDVLARLLEPSLDRRGATADEAALLLTELKPEDVAETRAG
jgi:hypothetical protein